MVDMDLNWSDLKAVLQNGDYYLESEPGKGTSFIITLPAYLGAGDATSVTLAGSNQGVEIGKIS